MDTNHLRLWHKAPTFWEDPRLMRLRGAWLEKQVELVEDIVEALPNGHVSQHEWRATVAEASIDARRYRTDMPLRGGPAYLALHRMRQTWEEEVMLFYTIGQPIEEGFDPDAHRQAMDRHHEERITWRPHHRLPGPPSRLYEPVPANGLTDHWWSRAPMQNLRRKIVNTLLMQNDTVARVLSDDPAYRVVPGRDWLCRNQGFGWPLQQRDAHLRKSQEQDHFERGVFAMMRGFLGEVQAFSNYGLPIQRDYDPEGLTSYCEARRLPPYHTPYLTRGAPGW